MPKITRSMPLFFMRKRSWWIKSAEKLQPFNKMTNLYPANLALSNGQLGKLNRAIKTNQAVTSRLKPENFRGPYKVFLTQMQINKLRKANSNGVGMDLRISKNQIRKATGGSLF